MSVTTSQPPNSPSERKVVERGEIQTANGYQYWATAEDEEVSTGRAALAIKAQKAEADAAAAAAKKGSGAKAVVWFFLLICLGLLGYFAFSLYQVYETAGQDQTRGVDAIVVLGAAQYNGEPSPVFAGRLDHAYDLWDAGEADRIITTGAKLEEDTFTEGFTGYEYLLERGVPDAELITIVDGRDTWEQISATANVLNEQELSSVLLVSDGYHSHRALAIADEFGIEAYVSPTEFDGNVRDYVREAVAVSIGRVAGYDRISAFNN